jgi:hypothetical protein
MQPDVSVPVQPTQTVPWPVLSFDSTDRVLVLAPHPDDESLVCGGLIQHALDMDLPVHVAFYTYGDNNEWSFVVYRKRPEVLPWQVREMGEVRHGEALKATGVFGLSEENLTFLGYPDFGTLHMWGEHWGDAPPAEPSDELTAEERARFVGVESRSVQREGDIVQLTIGLSRLLGHELTASIYCFGYRHDRAFAEMPKLHVTIGRLHHSVSDGQQRVPNSSVEVKRQARTVTLRVPMAAAGQPERLLVNATTRLGKMPVHVEVWRILELV